MQLRQLPFCFYRICRKNSQQKDEQKCPGNTPYGEIKLNPMFSSGSAFPRFSPFFRIVFSYVIRGEPIAEAPYECSEETQICKNKGPQFCGRQSKHCDARCAEQRNEQLREAPMKKASRRVSVEKVYPKGENF